MAVKHNSRTARRGRKLRLSLLGRPVSAEVNGVTLPLDEPEISDRVARVIYLGPYEHNETKIVEKTLEKNDIVVELGAGIGYMSTLCAKKIGSDRVFAYEANPKMARVIERTYALNAVKPNFDNAILAHGDGEVDFFLSPHYLSSSLSLKDGERVTVRKIDINRRLKEVGANYLICDIEGGEADLFEQLDLSGLNKICIELHPHLIGDEATTGIVKRLLDNGFLMRFSLTGDGCYFFERVNAG